MVISVFLMPVNADSTELSTSPNVVYVNSIGTVSATDTRTAYKTVQAAVDALNGADGYVVVTNTAEDTDVGGSTIKVTGGNVVITSVDPTDGKDYRTEENGSAFMYRNGRLSLYATNGSSITLDNLNDIKLNGSDMDVREGTIVFGSGLVTKHKTSAHVRMLVSGGAATAPVDVDITYATAESIYQSSGLAGGNAATTGANFNNLKLTFKAGTTGAFYLGAGSGDKATTVNNPAFITVENNDEIKLYRGNGASTYVQQTTFNGLQVLFVNSAKSTISDSKYGYYTNKGKEYIVYAPNNWVTSSTFGKVNITIPEGVSGKITNGESVTPITASGEYTLAEGTSTVTFERARKDVVYVNADVYDGVSTFNKLQTAVDALDGDGTVVVTNTNKNADSYLWNGLTVNKGRVIITSVDPVTGTDYFETACLSRAGRHKINTAANAYVIFDKVMDWSPSGSELQIASGNVFFTNNYRGPNHRIIVNDTNNTDVNLNVDVDFTGNNSNYFGLAGAAHSTALNSLTINIGNNTKGTLHLGTVQNERTITVAEPTFINGYGVSAEFKIVKGSKAATAGTTTLNGLQILFADSAASVEACAETETYTNDGEEYIIYVTNVEGSNVSSLVFGRATIEIPEGYKAIVTNGEAEEELTESCVYTLTAGTTNISFEEIKEEPEETNDLGIETTVFDENSTDRSAEFVIPGVQIRTEGVQGLRFFAYIGKDILANYAALNAENKTEFTRDDIGIGYGFVILPETLLGDNKLEKTTADVGIVSAAKTFAENDEYLTYTVVIKDIKVENYKRNYTVVPYITYKDADGVEKTVYGEQYTANVYDTASAGIEKETDESVISILESVKQAYDDLGIEE